MLTMNLAPRNCKCNHTLFFKQLKQGSAPLKYIEAQKKLLC